MINNIPFFSIYHSNKYSFIWLYKALSRQHRTGFNPSVIVCHALALTSVFLILTHWITGKYRHIAMQYNMTWLTNIRLFNRLQSTHDSSAFPDDDITIPVLLFQTLLLHHTVQIKPKKPVSNWTFQQKIRIYITRHIAYLIYAAGRILGHGSSI